MLYQGKVTLLVMDGKTLIAVDSISGIVLWKNGLGPSLIEEARAAICTDDRHVYVAADGILRAFAMPSGGLIWERYLGSAGLTWKVCLSGSMVMAYPGHSGHANSDAKIAVCDAATGAYLQRLSLPQRDAQVQFQPTPHTTLVACGGTLIGWGR